MGIVGWMVVGAVTGWLAGRLLGRGAMGCITDVPIGVGGGMFGGAVYAMATGHDALFAFHPLSLVAAAIGGGVLVWVGSKLFSST